MRARASATSAGSSAALASASTIRGGAGRRRAEAGSARRYSSNCAGRDGGTGRSRTRLIGAPEMRELARPGDGAGHEIAVDAPVDDAERDRRVDADRLAAGHEVERRLPAGETRQADRAAGAGQEPEADFREPELQVAGCAAVMAGERGLRAAAERRAVERRDDRLGAGLEARQHGGQQRLDRRPVELAHVGAGHECTARAREHDGAHGRVGVERLDGVEQLANAAVARAR